MVILTLGLAAVDVAVSDAVEVAVEAAESDAVEVASAEELEAACLLPAAALVPEPGLAPASAGFERFERDIRPRRGITHESQRRS